MSLLRCAAVLKLYIIFRLHIKKFPTAALPSIVMGAAFRNFAVSEQRDVTAEFGIRISIPTFWRIGKESLGNLLLGVFKRMPLHGGMPDGNLCALAGNTFHRHGAFRSKKQHQPLPGVGRANALPLEIRKMQIFQLRYCAKI